MRFHANSIRFAVQHAIGTTDGRGLHGREAVPETGF
jgi:hypothetical protein